MVKRIRKSVVLHDDCYNNTAVIVTLCIGYLCNVGICHKRVDILLCIGRGILWLSGVNISTILGRLILLVITILSLIFIDTISLDVGNGMFWGKGLRGGLHICFHCNPCLQTAVNLKHGQLFCTLYHKYIFTSLVTEK